MVFMWFLCAVFCTVLRNAFRKGFQKSFGKRKMHQFVKDFGKCFPVFSICGDQEAVRLC